MTVYVHDSWKQPTYMHTLTQLVATHVDKHIIVASYIWLLHYYCSSKTIIAAWKSKHNLADIAAVCTNFTKYHRSVAKY